MTTLTLDAGCYRVTPIAGRFTAWHPWSVNLNCNPDGSCERGWTMMFNVHEAATGDVIVLSRPAPSFCETEALALDTAVAVNFSLPVTTEVAFAIPDSCDTNQLVDNLGGVTLRVDPACPNDANVFAIGAGTPGTSGVPQLSLDGLPVPGTDFSMDVSSAAPSALAALFVAFNDTPADILLPQFGAMLLTGSPLVVVSMATDDNGEASVPVSIEPGQVTLCGSIILLQAIVADPTATGGIAFSAGLAMTIGK